LITSALVDLIGHLLEHEPALSGVYHVASEPISKYDLLVRLRAALGWDDITILPDDDFFCDRSLVAARFAEKTGWKAPDWEEMVARLAAERPFYEKRRG
jgi:dTDP-4-dehydrorhamnose reductase